MRLFARPVPPILLLTVFSFIPVLNVIAQSVQRPTGSHDEDSAPLAVAPLSWVVHVLARAAFGLAGPMNFVSALRRRIGRLHPATGWISFGAALAFGFSAVSLLFSVRPQRTLVVDITRSVFGVALLAAVAGAIVAIRRRDSHGHRASVIRA